MNFLNSLNEKQREAVTSSFKYNRIIAGAGSGKTRVLTSRICYLLDEGNLEPQEILAITFTNKAAREMKGRTKMMLNQSLSALQISTFHSFCALFLRNEISCISIPRSFSIIDDEDKEKIIYNACHDLGYEVKKRDPLYLQAIAFISKNKNKGDLPSDVDSSRFNERTMTLLSIFERYEQIKLQSLALDFDDLLIYTRNILREFPSIRQKYQERFKEILVDEFQDTNNLQYELILYLAGRDTGIFVVGDPDQTIYTWRGANQRIILDIENDFKGMKTTILNENYRSTGNILNVANKLIKNNKERIPKDLFTRKEEGLPVEVLSCESEYNEANQVIKKILDLKESHSVSYKDIAILYRSSFVSRSFEQALIKERIPYKTFSGTKFFERREIKDVLAYLSLMVNKTNDIAFERIYNVPKRKIGDKTFATFKREASEKEMSLLEYASLITKETTSLSEQNVKAFNELASSIQSAKDDLDNGEQVDSVIHNLLDEIDYYDYLAKEDEDEDRLNNIRSLISDIVAFLQSSEEDNLTLSEYLQNVTLLTNQDEIKDDGDFVTLMTIHVAKGLEYDYIFLVGFEEGVFPSSKSLEERQEALEEERRLAYVAYTRAKKELIISYNLQTSFVTHKAQVGSRFLKESGLTYQTKLYQSFKNKNEKTKYSFNLLKKEDIEKERERREKVVGVQLKNNVDWKVGDKLNHKNFGNGKVIEVDERIITIEFEEHGIKKIIKDHFMLKKI